MDRDLALIDRLEHLYPAVVADCLHRGASGGNQSSKPVEVLLLRHAGHHVVVLFRLGYVRPHSIRRKLLPNLAHVKWISFTARKSSGRGVRQ